MNWQLWVQETGHILKSKFSESEAYRLLKNLKEDFLISETELSSSELDILNDSINRLVEDEPIQYITGKAYFYDICLKVSPSVLIPRPETEELVDLVLQSKARGKTIQILDIGTGSGCIPIVIKRKWPQAIVTSCDVSDAALSIARVNGEELSAGIEFLQCDFLNSTQRNQLLQGPWDIIISNPPYIPAHEAAKMGDNVLQYEPHLALFTEDEKGLTFYKAIAEFALIHLKVKGAIYLEMNEFQASRIKEIYTKIGMNASIINDLSGKPRILHVIKES